MNYRQLRHLLFSHLDPHARSGFGLSRVNFVISLLILAAVATAILETEPLVREKMGPWLWRMEAVFFAVFVIEYSARVVAAGEYAQYRGVRGRLRYMCSVWAIVDLLAVLPFILSYGIDNAFFLRFLRVLRLLRVARLGRFSQAWDALAHALARRGYELLLSVMLALLLLVVSSALLYTVEADIQPEAFGSIPRAFWWSVATLTTVGYGDVTPVTGLGRVFAGLTAVSGIGLIAMPTGIMAAAFSDAFQETKQRKLEMLQKTNNSSKNELDEG